ncbi:MAG: peptidyl-tRNA hydrolase [Candidatus Tokpelaia sp. JSC085]|nr:MAG: peptidyl-tRNA hydrolase [Candidatus Tokpelaia sp. JSC085]
MPFLVAGLGNPGSSYERSRHNIGFMAVDAIYDCYHFSPWSRKFQALITNGIIGREQVLLIKPQLSMNLSGQTIGEVMRFYKLEPDRLVVIHDELDLPKGNTRIKTGGGTGGHNGIKSIDAHCGKHYCRVRLGIGHPGHKDLVLNHVLGPFSKIDSIWLEPLLAAVANHIDLILKGENSTFMNKMTKRPS